MHLCSYMSSVLHSAFVGIANFTDVAKTFTGIIRALREEVHILLEHSVSVWVRRGGPNYQVRTDTRNLTSSVPV